MGRRVRLQYSSSPHRGTMGPAPDGRSGEGVGGFGRSRNAGMPGQSTTGLFQGRRIRGGAVNGKTDGSPGRPSHLFRF